MKLPPYGKMGEGYFEAIAAENVPPDFLPSDTNRDVSWHKWLLSMKDLMADNLWPSYDTTTGGWNGAAQDFAEDLVRFEVAMMMECYQTNGSF
ncbi:hypothetical protein ACFQY5_02625 [Paeniroseomonas aquatica]|uniref:Uncharacterized protein n=1 Tax=Paeniroseomonas aquatica TaxID=373043 RepID=A0ABT8A5W2_9PROT|nr:hypothetical protein [Paeniroseomonas aquatica]MDN3564974.1 hypothetical protein [Paeniroseomonas aquatica]